MSKWEARWLEATEAGSDYLQRIVSHFEPQEEPAQDDEIKAWMREHFKERTSFVVDAKERFPNIEIAQYNEQADHEYDLRREREERE